MHETQAPRTPGITHSFVTLFTLLVCTMLPRVGVAQTVVDVHSFTNVGNSQYPSFSGPTQGRNGQIYGTTSGSNYGSVFHLLTSGAEGDLFAFDDADGYGPLGGVTLGTDGNFYGVTIFGGTANYGVLYRVTSSGTYTVLHNFLDGSDGLWPGASPVEASDGNFYGTTEGDAPSTGATVYRFTPPDSFSTIYQFDSTVEIAAPLIEGSNGNIYGTTYSGGASGCGSVFELTTAGILVMQSSFSCTGSFSPAGSLVQGSDGNFYGTNYTGSGSVGGSVFKMTPEGRISILHTFSNSGGGPRTPDGGVIQATDGNLYGSTKLGGSRNYGTLFQVTPSGSYSELYSFVPSLGEYPSGSLLQHTNGLLYGGAYLGGTEGYGSIFSLNMGLGPFVAFVVPVGAAGQSAQILGQGFTGTTAVTFNGVPAASFKVASDTFLTAVVPSGATTGKVVVTTPGGTLTSNVNFRIIN